MSRGKNYVSPSYTCITHFLSIICHVYSVKLHNPHAFLKCFMDVNDMILIHLSGKGNGMFMHVSDCRNGTFHARE